MHKGALFRGPTWISKQVEVELAERERLEGRDAMIESKAFILPLHALLMAAGMWDPVKGKVSKEMALDIQTGEQFAMSVSPSLLEPSSGSTKPAVSIGLTFRGDQATKGANALFTMLEEITATKNPFHHYNQSGVLASDCLPFSPIPAEIPMSSAIHRGGAFRNAFELALKRAFKRYDEKEGHEDATGRSVRDWRVIYENLCNVSDVEYVAGFQHPNPFEFSFNEVEKPNPEDPGFNFVCFVTINTEKGKCLPGPTWEWRRSLSPC
ncbi:hypothetical protein T439DRAFT_361170 [Meredithblackwellia eburnea MCA 4105]